MRPPHATTPRQIEPFIEPTRAPRSSTNNFSPAYASPDAKIAYRGDMLSACTYHGAGQS